MKRSVIKMAIPGLEILMSKLNELSQLLTSAGYECDIIAVTDYLPRVQLYLRNPQEQDITVYDTVQLAYIPPKDASFSHFYLNLVTELEVNEENYKALQAACDVFNLSTVSGFACIGGGMDKIVYRAMLPEVGEPSSEKLIKFFVKGYIDGLEVLKQLISAAP